MNVDDAVTFGYSLAIGLLLGFERERSHSRAVGQIAGSRTFALLALSGTLAAFLGPWVIVAGLAGVAALLVVGYQRTSDDDPGTTTEVAALATYLLGALCLTHAPLAAGLAIITAVLLTSKHRIHAFARDIVSEVEVDDALKFLVVAFVVLPLLPDKDLGPYGVLNPAHVWLIVVALTGISWVGYVAVRALGARRGLLVTGLAGGFVSASATTASMGRLYRSTGALAATVAAAQLASVATFVQLLAIIAVVNRTVAEHLWPPLLVGSLLLAGVVGTGTRRAGRSAASVEAEAAGDDTATTAAIGRPFELRPALILAGVLTLAILVGRWGAATFGPRGAVLAAGAAGMADAHAGALSSTTLYNQGQLSLATTLVCVGAALATNTMVKCGLAFSAGGRHFGWRFTAGIVPVYTAVIVGLAVTAAVA